MKADQVIIPTFKKSRLCMGTFYGYSGISSLVFGKKNYFLYASFNDGNVMKYCLKSNKMIGRIRIYN